MNVTSYDTAERLPDLNDEDQAQYDDWVRQKIAMARADERPALTIAEARQRIRDRLDALQHV